MNYRLINAEVLEGLRQIADESVQCVVTSPPYWGLRDYGTAKWEGGDPTCDHRLPKKADPYIEMSRRRLSAVAPLLAQEITA